MFVGFLAVVLSAPGPSGVSVVRAEAAWSCPDAAGLAQRGAAQCPRTPLDATSDTPTFVVRFSPNLAGFSALIEGRFGERSLSTTEPTCDGLAEAVTVTMCLLLRDPAMREPPEATWTPFVFPAVGAVFPWTTAAAPAGSLSLGLEHRTGVFGAVAAVATLPQFTQLSRGAIETWSLHLDAKLGFQWHPTRRLDVAVFFGALLGTSTATGRETALTRTASDWSVGLQGVAFIGVRLVPWLSVTLSAAAWATLRRPQFVIEGASAPVQPSPISAAIFLGPLFRFE